MRHSLALLVIALSCLAASVQADKVIVGNDTTERGQSDSKGVLIRAYRGLIALYDFDSLQNGIVRDKSGVGRPVDLTIQDPDAVTQSLGALEVRKSTLIRSERPARRISEAVRRTGELTVEAWVRPANKEQSGPARIVTLSTSSTNRNFTLGQDGEEFDARLRAAGTSDNGLPSLSSGSMTVSTEPTHVAYTRSRQGKASFYLNGELTKERRVVGSMANWDASYSMAFANELDKSRPWLGTYYLVAIYNRRLSSSEIRQNYQVGHDVEAPAQLARSIVNPRARHFENHVAPLLARHCLECHDSATRQGGLDLSRKSTAMAGGDSGRAIVAGDSAGSLLCDLVATDEMPQDRDSLTESEKTLLKKWIDEYEAEWSLEMIDPAVYVHGNRVSRNWLRRLTVTEYIETVRAAVGVDISKEAREILPADLRADGFTNTAYNLHVDLKHIEGYGRLAEIIVDRMEMGPFVQRFATSRRFTDKDMGSFISKMGKWLLRGPLDQHEVISFRGISTSVIAAGGGFDEAASLIVEAMLQSPRFIYRMENQRGDGSSLPVNEYELASRLSYMIWGGPPDQQLMRAADDGELAGSNLENHIRRMLDDQRAVEHSLRFISDWLDLGRLENLQPNKEKFPHWDQHLADDMRRETLEYARNVLWTDNRPLSDLMNAHVTFVTPRLASHYGLTPRSDPRDSAAYDLSLVPSRGGLLTQGSVLTVGGDEASTVTRGLFIMRELLRGVVKDPPPCVDTTPIPTKPGLTQRAIAMNRIANASCGGCHAKFEPLAFGLEKFDGLGGFHERDEHGNPLRDDGDILFPGRSKAVEYESSSELMDMLAGSDRVQQTMTWKLTQFALGRPLVGSDAATVDKIHNHAQMAGGRYKDVISAIVMSDLVQRIQTEQAEEE